jgi:hypothetical protein
MIKLRSIRWAGTVECMEEMHTDFWFVNLKERDRLENQEDGRMYLKETGWESVDRIRLAENRGSGIFV